MKVNSIRSYQNVNSTHFKAAVPVFVHLVPKGKTIEEAVPVTTEKMVNGYRQQLTQYLNNSVDSSNNLQRFSLIKKLRDDFGQTVKDFCGIRGVVDKTSKVKAFTCMDGGLNGKTLKPLFYYTTGNTKRSLEALETDYANARKFSQGNRTAEIERMNRIYPLRGQNIVNNGYTQLNQYYGHPLAFHVYFTDEYTKTGNLKGHTLVDYKFKPAKEDPSITL